MKAFYSAYNIQIYTPKSLLISWDLKSLDPEFVVHLQAFMAYLKTEDKTIKYMTPSFDALMIVFKENLKSINRKINEIEKLFNNLEHNDIKTEDTKLFEIPVCYKEFGEDLLHLSKHSGLSVDEVIKIHTKGVYTLFFTGFLPGFLYLGTVDERIQIPRKSTPRVKVEQGSVGIAEQQTGIYPSASPGGWQIIGRTPLKFFDVNKMPPSPFKPGDQIKFKPIDKNEFDDLFNDKNKTINLI